MDNFAVVVVLYVVLICGLLLGNFVDSKNVWHSVLSVLVGVVWIVFCLVLLIMMTGAS